jgi:hypothetical protein
MPIAADAFKSIFKVITNIAAEGSSELVAAVKLVSETTEFVNDVAMVFSMPSSIRAEIIECTDTVEGRNIAIIYACMIRYVAEIKLYNNNKEELTT